MVPSPMNPTCTSRSSSSAPPGGAGGTRSRAHAFPISYIIQSAGHPAAREGRAVIEGGAPPAGAPTGSAASPGLSVQEVADAVAAVTIHRPPNNFFDTPLIRAIADTFDALEGTGCRAIVLRSEGKHFCAGRDFSEPRDEGDAPEQLYAEAVRLLTGRASVGGRDPGCRDRRRVRTRARCRLPRRDTAGQVRRQLQPPRAAPRVRDVGAAPPPRRASRRRRSCCTPASGSTVSAPPTSGCWTGWSTRPRSTPRRRPSPPGWLPPPRWRCARSERRSGVTWPSGSPGRPNTRRRSRLACARPRTSRRGSPPAGSDESPGGSAGEPPGRPAADGGRRPSHRPDRGPRRPPGRRAPVPARRRAAPVVRSRPHDPHRRRRHRGRARRSPPGRRGRRRHARTLAAPRPRPRTPRRDPADRRPVEPATPPSTTVLRRLAASSCAAPEARMRPPPSSRGRSCSRSCVACQPRMPGYAPAGWGVHVGTHPRGPTARDPRRTATSGRAWPATASRSAWRSSPHSRSLTRDRARGRRERRRQRDAC